jgi:hypothetical protein
VLHTVQLDPEYLKVRTVEVAGVSFQRVLRCALDTFKLGDWSEMPSEGVVVTLAQSAVRTANMGRVQLAFVQSLSV